ncbi:MAG: hypothetical protein JWN21_476 [Sphingomonas bacterium]|uniref:hypothetical protein n=1 Tax=Sphingomonas bacterium TaxID=1895847 RepID=UPI002636622E|nr:hypothetical protein [Sphingomonas bacterium]MDB5694933.1 hypothetical protein [Sphingomonas bacterium]
MHLARGYADRTPTNAHERMAHVTRTTALQTESLPITASPEERSYLRSSTLEKVLEHRLVGELASVMWLRGDHDLEVLRGEVDAHGYDVVLEANGVLRHIQLKAMMADGKRSSVSVNVRLARKPSGCVVWMRYNPADLALGPFYWFGAEPGAPLPPLGSRVAKHTKSNSQGQKTEREGHRVVRASVFQRLETAADLAEALFGPPGFSRRTELLRRHVSSRAAARRA